MTKPTWTKAEETAIRKRLSLDEMRAVSCYARWLWLHELEAPPIILENERKMLAERRAKIGDAAFITLIIDVLPLWQRRAKVGAEEEARAK